MSAGRVRDVGSTASLVEFTRQDEAMAAHARLIARPLSGQRDVIGGMRTVLVRFDTRLDRSTARISLEALSGLESSNERGREIVVEAVYDGEDLLEVGAMLGLSADAVVRWHSAEPWRVAFAGFAPGFHYLVRAAGGPAIPRRASPRTAVPAGAVAVADRFSGVYPAASPGGWQLLGRTTARVWDLDRAEPSLLRGGDSIRFLPVRHQSRVAHAPLPPTVPHRAPGVIVARAGVSTLLQDLGRVGHGRLGVPDSGALDRTALRDANWLVGNREGTPAFEIAFGGARLVAVGDLVVAACGADAPLVVQGTDGSSRQEQRASAFALRSGEALTIARMVRGARTYIAVRGGIDARAELGSVASDSLSGLGTPPVEAGTYFAVGSADGTVQLALEGANRTLPPTNGPTIVHLVLGPRDDWFTPQAIELLTTQEWTVGSASNRVGLRLEGAVRLPRSNDDELPSEGVVAGSIQVPASGQPIVFLADHPVTGGYPVIAVVEDSDLDALGQLRAGSPVRFRARTDDRATGEDG